MSSFHGQGISSYFCTQLQQMQMRTASMMHCVALRLQQDALLMISASPTAKAQGCIPLLPSTLNV